MALNNLKMVFGEQSSPSTLSQSNVLTLINAIADEGNDVILGGYALVTGGIKESDKITLENKGLHIVNTTITSDSYRIYAEKNSILEGGSTDILGYNINMENVVLTVASVSVSSSDIANSIVLSKIHLNGTKLTVDAADENATWTARVTISGYPSYAPTNIQTCTVTISAIGVQEIEIEGEAQVAFGSNSLYTIKAIPENNTKYEPNIEWEAVSGVITNGSYLATAEVDKDTITAKANYYGTVITGTKEIVIGNAALDNDTLNPRVFAVVKAVLGLPEAIESITSMDMQFITNALITEIWDMLRGQGSQANPITFDEFQYCTGVDTLSSIETGMLNMSSVKFPKTLKNIEGSVLTLNGAIYPDFKFSDCGTNSLKLYGPIFMGSTVKTIDLDNVSNVYFGGLTQSMIYGLCFNCTQLLSVNWRGIYNWGETGRYSALSGGHFQGCTKLETIYSNGSSTYTINGGIFYGDSALRGVFDQDGNVIKDFAAKLTNTTLTNQFYNCQLFELDSLNQDLTILGDNAFYNCLNLTADHPLPYLYTLGNSFNGANNAFTSKELVLGQSSSATTITLPSTQITPSGVNRLVLGHRYATTLSKSTPDNYSGNYSNITDLDITALTRLTRVDYSVLVAFRNTTITFNTNQVPALNYFDDSVSFNGTIKVPASLLTAWKAADNWNMIADRIEAA